MRLLNTITLELCQFIGNKTPPYAILSHTWGNSEATFQDAPKFPRLRGRLAYLRQFRPPNALDDDDDDDDDLLTPGTCKILDFCDLALSDGHLWAWADTCCIDKSSSAELSEAINSMYRWYAESDSCYVYLSDVRTSSTEPGLFSHEALEKSRWFTRGWTLQELLAPRLLEFYDVDWKSIGTKLHLCIRIAARTGIPESVLLEPGNMDFQEFPAGRRFSWACDRTTTREEDMAYSLMGLLDVNMPLMYGEGGVKAFYRLQQKYLLQREDLSLLLWTSTTMEWRVNRDPAIGQLSGPGTILARHPVFFHRSQALVDLDPNTGDFSETLREFKWANVVPVPRSHQGDPLTITSRGLRVKLLAMRDPSSVLPGWIAFTSYFVMGTDGQPASQACIYLEPSKSSPYVKGSTPIVTRRGNYVHHTVVVFGVADTEGFKWQEFYLDYRYEGNMKHAKRTLEIRLDVPENAKVGVSIFPPELGLVDGTSGKYQCRLTPERLSFPPMDVGSCLSLQIGALILDIPAPALPDSTPVVETVAVTFGFTGAGSRSEALRGAQCFGGSLVWCDIVKVPTESRPSEAMETFLRELGDRALSAVLPDPKDKCHYNLEGGKVLWTFVQRGNADRETKKLAKLALSFPSTIHVVLQDEGNPEMQPRWLSCQTNATLFPAAPRDWR